MPKNLLLALGYALAGFMAMAIVFLPANVLTLVFVFVAGGIYIAAEETLEDSLCAELVGPDHHGMAFGVLATVNGIGDLLSSIVVGALWSAYGTGVAVGYSGLLFFLAPFLPCSYPRAGRGGPDKAASVSGNRARSHLINTGSF